MSTEKPLETISVGAGIVFIGLIISKLLGFFYRLIVARIGPEQFGLLSLGLALLGVLGIVSVLGTNEGVLRYASYYKEKNDPARVKGTFLYSLRLTFLLSIILSVLVFIFSDFISINVFHDGRLSVILKVIAFAIPFDSLRTIFYGMAKAYKEIKYYVISKNIIENLAKVIFTLILVYLGYGVLGAAIAYALAIFFSFVIILFYTEKRVFSIVNSKIVSIYDRKQLLSYSIPLLFYYVVILAISWTDTFFLGIFRSAAEVGIYNAALPMALLVYIFPNALLALFVPVLTDLYARGDKNKFSMIYTTVTKWIFLVNLIILSILILFPKKILLTLFGADYTSGYFVLIILSVANFLYALSQTQNQSLLVYERTKTISLITAVGAGINVILNAILVPFYGILGAGTATGIALAIMSISFYIVSYKITNINPLKFPLFRIFFSVIVSSLAVYFFVKVLNFIPNIIVLVISIIVLSVIYMLALLITKSINEDDLTMLRLMQKKLGIRISFINEFIRKFV